MTKAQKKVAAAPTTELKRKYKKEDEEKKVAVVEEKKVADLKKKKTDNKKKAEEVVKEDVHMGDAEGNTEDENDNEKMVDVNQDEDEKFTFSDEEDKEDEEDTNKDVDEFASGSLEISLDKKTQSKIESKIAKLGDLEKLGTESAVVYLGRIPTGFYEHQMKRFFGQFGKVLRLRVSRNKKTGKPKHYAFIEFKYAEVAKVVAETMNNYLMFGRILKCQIVPKEKVHPKIFKGANRVFKPLDFKSIQGQQRIKPESDFKKKDRVKKFKKNLEQRIKKLKEAGIDYDFNIVEKKKEEKKTEVKEAKNAQKEAPKEVAKPATTKQTKETKETKQVKETKVQPKETKAQPKETKVAEAKKVKEQQPKEQPKAQENKPAQKKQAKEEKPAPVAATTTSQPKAKAAPVAAPANKTKQNKKK